MPVPPSAYTKLTLKQAFGLFWFILIGQVISVVVAKSFSSKSYQKARWVEKLIHAVENCNLIYPWEDWDIQNGNVDDHRARMKEVRWELFYTWMVNLIWSIVLLIPLFCTGDLLLTVESKWDPCVALYNIIHIISGYEITLRHHDLAESIGTFPQENYAYNQSLFLQALAPTLVMIFSISELICIALSNDNCHPFNALISNRK